MEKKKILRFLSLVMPVVLSIGIVCYVPELNFILTRAELAAVQANRPLDALEDYKENLTSNIPAGDAQDNKAPSDNTGNESGDGEQDEDGDSAVEASKRQNGDLTETPDDILKLQQEAEASLDEETKKGDITEEAYTGSGSILAYEKVKVQSKIPESFYKLDIQDLLEQKADLVITDKTKPTVLIYHSHTTEAYQTLDVGYYTTSFQSRLMDTSQTVVRVGEEIAAQLESAGYNVIHDKTIYDKSYSLAYGLSDQALKRNLEKYPSIDVTIDVHRDAIQYSDGTKVKPTATINGKKAAQMMIIAGCEYGDIENFPDWEYNLRFALQLQQTAEEMFEGVMRPILFSARRYNMFNTHNSILLEVGSDGSTLEEACYSGRLIGAALAAMLEDYIVE